MVTARRELEDKIQKFLELRYPGEPPTGGHRASAMCVVDAMQESIQKEAGKAAFEALYPSAKYCCGCREYHNDD